MTLDIQEKKLTPSQLLIADALVKGEDVRDLIKKTYNVTTDDAVDMIIESLSDNKAVTDYMYTKTQIQIVENELYMNATLEEPTGPALSVKQKAIDSFLDRTKGKATNNVDIKSDGQKLNIVIASEIANRYDTPSSSK